jgi:cytochrome c oxidase cbb3-type subunit 4
MDLNTLRSLVTVLSFAVFLGIIAWTFSRERRAAFDAAAALPFADEGRPALPGGGHE